MTDLLVHGPPAIRVNSGGDGKLRPSPHSSASSLKKRSHPQKHAEFQPLSKIIRDAGNLVLSLRDGLTESERESRRRNEERMQILAARMQNVSLSKQWVLCLTQWLTGGFRRRPP